MIVGELPLDEGDVILTKGKTLGYLAQHQNLDTTNTIYEELKTAKSDIIALEAQIRAHPGSSVFSVHSLCNCRYTCVQGRFQSR